MPREKLDDWPVNYLSDGVLARIEQALEIGEPNLILRRRLNVSVAVYLHPRQEMVTEPPKWLNVRSRLKKIGKAASKLHNLLNEDPVELEAQTGMQDAVDRFLAKSKTMGKTTYVGSDFAAAMSRAARKLPESKHKAFYLKLWAADGRASEADAPGDRAVLLQISGMFKGALNIDASQISHELGLISKFVESLKPKKSGPNALADWYALMSSLANIFKEIKGKPPKVTYNAVSSAYRGGTFLRAAKILDREVSLLCSPPVEPLSGSTIGSRLQKLLKSRAKNRKRVRSAF
jgi:hypothetical protein